MRMILYHRFITSNTTPRALMIRSVNKPQPTTNNTILRHRAYTKSVFIYILKITENYGFE